MKKLTVEDYFDLIKKYNLIVIRLKPDDLMVIKDDWEHKRLDRFGYIDTSKFFNVKDKVDLEIFHIYDEPIHCTEEILKQVLENRTTLFMGQQCNYKIIEVEQYDQQVYDAFRVAYRMMPKDTHKVTINIIKNIPVETLKIKWTLNYD
jgi:methionine-rich copper-binding protein CopC